MENLVEVSINIINPPEIFDSYDTLVLAGGSIKGLCSLGAIQWLIDNKYIDNIDNYVATSVGTIIAYLIIIGYEPVEIMAYLSSNNITQKLSTFNFQSMLTGGSAMSFSVISDELEKMTITKVGMLLNMKELYDKFKKKFICTTFNMTENKTEYISHENYPEMPCLIAIKLSCNLPFIFEEYKYKNSYYIDGGISDNFPIEYAQEIGKWIIGINIKKESKNKSRNEMNMIEYIFQLLTISISSKNNKIKDPAKCKIIDLLSDIKFYNFNLKRSEQLDLFSLGYNQISQQF